MERYQLNLSGVIDTSSNLLWYYQQEIDAGIVTMPHLVAKALAEAGGRPLDIRISSPGGVVDSGYEIIEMIKSYIANNPSPDHRIQLGSYCASMASVIALRLSKFCKVTAHDYTVFMVHQCSVFFSDTASASQLESEAHALRIINQSIKASLTACGVSEQVADSWLADGVDTNLSAKDLLEHGLVDAIIEQDEAAMVIDQAATSSLIRAAAREGSLFTAAKRDRPSNYTTLRAAVAVAEAFVNQEKGGGEMDLEARKRKAEADAKAAEEAAAKAAEEAAAAKAAEEAAAAKAAEEEAAAKAAEEEAAKAAEAAAKAAEEAAAKDKEIADLKDQLAKAQAEKDAIKQASAAAAAKAMGGESKPALSRFDRMAQAIKDCDGCYVDARKKYPEAFEI